MRILSKSLVVVLALLIASCAPLLPWRNEPIGDEVNLGFTLERNLIDLTTVTIDGRRGRFVLGTAAQKTVIDPLFAPDRSQHTVELSQKQTVALAPERVSLGGVADAIVGADAWSNRAISIDYRKGLVTFQKEGFQPGLMNLYRFSAEPTIEVTVAGRTMNAIVDTSSPDTLVIPSSQHVRGSALVRIAGVDLGAVDVQYANVAHARIGNRLLANFLVTIDYGQRIVGLWHDPRATS